MPNPTRSKRTGLRPLSPSERLEPSRAPSRPRASKSKRKVSGFVRLVSGLLTTVFILMIVAGGLGFIFYRQLNGPGPLTEERTFAVPRGEGRLSIAARLEREGVISNRWSFIVAHLMRTGFGTAKGMDLKAGEFSLPANATMNQILNILIKGRALLYKVTVPEGRTSLQTVARLNADENLSGEIAIVPPEGSLLPDTYAYAKGADRQELLDRMHEEQRKFLQQAWQSRQTDLPISTMEDALILASIVEKETGQPDERDRVAAVFINRLRKNMRLQSDPTIIYGIVAGKGSLGRPIYRRDIQQKTPYNTYQIDGLPPTPICNPGRESIKAVLNPADTDELYFVADGTGGHTFSKTLKQHNAAVANWRKIERAARAKSRKQAAAAAKAQAATITTAPEPTASTIPAPAAGSGPVPLPRRKPK